MAGCVVEAARGDFDESLETRLSNRLQQRRALIAEDLISRKRLRQKRMHGLLGAAEELECCREPLVRLDRVAERYHIDAAAAQTIINEPADDGQPVGRRVAMHAPRLRLGVRNRGDRSIRRAYAHGRRLLVTYARL